MPSPKRLPLSKPESDEEPASASSSSVTVSDVCDVGYGEAEAVCGGWGVSCKCMALS